MKKTETLRPTPPGAGAKESCLVCHKPPAQAGLEYCKKHGIEYANALKKNLPWKTPLRAAAGEPDERRRKARTELAADDRDPGRDGEPA